MARLDTWKVLLAIFRKRKFEVHKACPRQEYLGGAAN
jgi:succinylarginine dihydrolase